MRNFPKQTFAGALAAAFSSVAFAQLPSIPPSPSWTRALPAGPDTRVKIHRGYAMHVARDAYFWAWPLVNVYNKRLAAAAGEFEHEKWPTMKLTSSRHLARGPQVLPTNSSATTKRVTRLRQLPPRRDRHVFRRLRQAWGIRQFVPRCDLPLEDTGVRPNRDTLYSQAMFDFNAGPVRITLPDAGKQFMSPIVIDQNHYVPEVVCDAGRTVRASYWDAASAEKGPRRADLPWRNSAGLQGNVWHEGSGRSRPAPDRIGDGSGRQSRFKSCPRDIWDAPSDEIRAFSAAPGCSCRKAAHCAPHRRCCCPICADFDSHRRIAFRISTIF